MAPMQNHLTEQLLYWIHTPKLIDTNIPKLVYHTATALDKLMFVTFGKLFFFLKKKQPPV